MTGEVVDVTSKLDKIEELLFIDCKYKYTRKAHIDSAHWFADGEREEFSTHWTLGVMISEARGEIDSWSTIDTK